MKSQFIPVESLTVDAATVSATAKMTKLLAVSITGGLGNPSKMPGKAYGISASLCITGSKLAKIPGSVCHGCYALKGRYVMANVKTAHARRLAGLQHPRWAEAMVYLIGREKNFRWHDSGDLQSVEHLRQIIDVVTRTPRTDHWMPTREYKIVEDFRNAGGVIPSNLVIRLSAHMIDTPPPSGYGLPTSTVHSGTAMEGKKAIGYECPARYQGNICGNCRACWQSEVSNVSYHIH